MASDDPEGTLRVAVDQGVNLKALRRLQGEGRIELVQAHRAATWRDPRSRISREVVEKHDKPEPPSPSDYNT
jgi:hypothetical protein